MFEWFNQMSDAMKNRIISLLTFAVCGGAIVGVVYFMLSSALIDQAYQRLAVNVQVMKEFLLKHGDSFYMRDNKLMVGDYMLNDNNDFIEEITGLVGGIATVFAGDMRVASNVMDENGKRAVGTRMAKGEVYDEVFVKGKTFNGELDVLGEAYLGSYSPVTDKNGTIIGAIVVAMKKSDRLKIVYSLVRNIAITILVLGFAMSEIQKRQTKIARRKMMGELASEFESNVGHVVSTVSSAATEMQGSAKSLSNTAEGASDQAAAAAAAAEQTSANVQTVAAAAEELNTSIGEINQQIENSVKVVSSGVAEAESTTIVMQDLNKSANDIGSVVKLIEGIADQVNLLALNATIEAARAGEAGRGFAVVANEVKSLASQAGNAARDITSQISDIQGKTNNAVSTIENISNTIKKISEITTAISSAVEEQGAATKEISRSIQEAAEGAKEANRNISGVTKSAAEAGAAATQVLGASGQLAKESETLRSVVNNFIAKVKEG